MREFSHHHAAVVTGHPDRDTATGGIPIDYRQVQERFVHAQGPGGRNLHKEATAVELRLDLKPLSLPPDVLDRLIVLAGKGVTNDGVLIVVSRVHLSQAQNRLAARDRLTALLESAFTPPKRRKPTKPRTRRAGSVASKRAGRRQTARRSGRVTRAAGGGAAGEGRRRTKVVPAPVGLIMRRRSTARSRPRWPVRPEPET